MDAETHAKLRAPFAPEQIGYIPRGGITLAYVGHAAVTDRLLSVDPDWTWEPAAVGPNGEPLITDGGLWIRLTVAGVTRYGYGDATAGKGVKEMIGDAIRNAAMRFGVGLDLWAKEDIAADLTGHSVSGEGGPADGPPESSGVTPEQAGPTPKRAAEREERLRIRGDLFRMITDLQTAGAPFPSGTPGGVTTWDEWRKAYILRKFGKHSLTQLTNSEVDHVRERVRREHTAHIPI